MQILRKYITDHAVNNEKIDPTDTYTITGLRVDGTSAVGRVSIGVIDPLDALHIRRTDTSAGLTLDLDDGGSGKAYQVYSDQSGLLNIKDRDLGLDLLSLYSVPSVGRVGINTTQPQDTIHARSILSSSALRLDLDDGFNGRAYRLVSDSDGAFKVVDVDAGSAVRLQISDTGTLTYYGDATFEENFQINGTVTVINTEIVVTDRLEINQTDATQEALIASQDNALATGTVVKIENLGSGPALTIDKGSVGIGTTNPLGALDVNQPSATHPVIIASQNNALATATVMMIENAGTGHGLTIDAGYVGFGTTNPLGALDIRTPSYGTHLRMAHFSGGGYDFYITSEAANNDYGVTRSIVSINEGINNVDTDALVMNHTGFSGGTTYFRDFIIASGKSSLVSIFKGSSGYVGFGTVTPNYNLQIEGGASNSIIQLTNNVSGHGASNGGRMVLDTASTVIIENLANARLDLATNAGAIRQSITGSGLVGIGTTNPGSLLHMHTSDADTSLFITTNGTTRDLYTLYQSNRSGSPITWTTGYYNAVNGYGISNGTTLATDNRLFIDANGVTHLNCEPDFSIRTILTLGNGIGAPQAGNGAAIAIGQSGGQYSVKIAAVFDNSSPSFLNPAMVFYTMYNTYLQGTEVERMRISSFGYVGIGHQGPGYLLTLGGDDSASPLDMISIGKATTNTGNTGGGYGILFQHRNLAGQFFYSRIASRIVSGSQADIVLSPAPPAAAARDTFRVTIGASTAETRLEVPTGGSTYITAYQGAQIAYRMRSIFNATDILKVVEMGAVDGGQTHITYGAGLRGISILSAGGTPGYVGVGTATPTEKLHVVGNILCTANTTTSTLTITSGIFGISGPTNVQFTLTRTGGGNGSAILAVTNGPGNYGWTTPAAGDSLIQASSGKKFYIGQAGLSDPYAVFYNGSVGIGTLSPSQALTVDNAIEVINTSNPRLFITRGSGGSTTHAIANSTTEIGWSGVVAGDSLIQSSAAQSLRLGSASQSTPTITISSTGQVGIGTTSTSYLLDVRGTGYFEVSNTASLIVIDSGTGSGAQGVLARCNSFSAHANSIAIEGSNWGLGIGVRADGGGKGLYATSWNGRAVDAYSANNGIGVYASSTNSYAVQAIASNSVAMHVTSNTNDAIQAYATAPGQKAVYASSTSGDAVYGITPSASGVYGISTNGSGVYGLSTNSNGVRGFSTAGYGVYAASTNNAAIYATSTNSYAGQFTKGTGTTIYTETTGTGASDYALHARTNNGGASATSSAILAQNYGSGRAVWATSGTGETIYATSSGGKVLYASAAGAVATTYALVSQCSNGSAPADTAAIRAHNNGLGQGIYVTNSSLTAWTLYVVSPHTINGQAGYFGGKVTVTGFLAKSGGGFRIDHPLDPKNKYLNHGFVESPDMRNMYYGQSTTINGSVVIDLPEWWTALNGNDKTEYSYSLTPIGKNCVLYINKEIENNQFEVMSDCGSCKFSWTISAIRHDDFAEKNKIIVEVEKEPLPI